MTATLIESDGEPFCLLIERPDGTGYLVPPIVLTADGHVAEGREVLHAIAESGVPVQLPVIRAATPGDVARIDQRMARVSERLGVPIGPPAG